MDKFITRKKKKEERKKNEKKKKKTASVLACITDVLFDVINLIIFKSITNYVFFFS